MHVQLDRSDRKINESSLSQIGPINKIIKWFHYIPESESKEDVLGWNKYNDITLTGSVSLLFIAHERRNHGCDQNNYDRHHQDGDKTDGSRPA